LVRENASGLKSQERERFCKAVIALKNETESGRSLNRYDEFVAIHLGVIDRIRNGNAIFDGGHGGPAFFAWHREYICRYEQALKSVDPTVSLPYWNWSSGDESDTREIFTEDFMGQADNSSNQGRITEGYFAKNQNTFNPKGWEIHPELDAPPWWKDTGFGSTLTRNPDLLANINDLMNIGQTAMNSLNEDNFHQFRPGLETPHGSVHMWIEGHMTSMASPNDPIFFLHHANVDRLWDLWEKNHPGPDNYNPNDTGRYGHGIDDPMWPWDGKNNTTTRARGADSNIPLEDLIPDFSDNDVVKPRDVIDHRSGCERYNS